MRIRMFVTTVCLTLLSTAAFAQSVTVDFDKGTDFSRIKTYAWVRGTPVPDALNHRRIMDAVNAQLTRKGLVETGPDERPDVLVAYHASFDRDLQISGFSTGWGGFRFPNQSGVARTEEILTGTLVVDIVDARTRTIVWRGIATRDVDVKANAARRDKNIARAAEKLFKQYPPAK